MITNLIDYQVRHKRSIPKKHEFDYSGFWTMIDILNRDNNFRIGPLFFDEKDHVKQAGKNLYSIIQDECDEEVKKIQLITNMRVFGYVFNPVSFYLVHTLKGCRLFIEICNTFNELKLFNAGYFQNSKVTYQTQKGFYISPFTRVDGDIRFNVKLADKSLSIAISSTQDKEEIVKTVCQCHIQEYTYGKLFQKLIRFPLNSFLIITSIHWHALKLLIKGVPYYKKQDLVELEKGVQKWKI